MNELNVWTKPSPIIHKGKIISSDAVLMNKKGFIPKYAKECRENMWLIMNNGYMKKWFEEVSEKAYRAQLSRDPRLNGKGVLKKRFFQRVKPTTIRPVKIISLKRFSDIKGKVDTNLGLPHSTL